MPFHLPPPSQPPTNHPVDVGERTEAIVLAELVRRGYKVLVPFGHNHRYDLVLDVGDRMLRIQCKTGRVSRGAIKFHAESIRSNTRGSRRRSYQDDADLFLVFCPELGKIYAVPVELAPATEATLRLKPTGNNQQAGVRWAADFELPA